MRHLITWVRMWFTKTNEPDLWSRKRPLTLNEWPARKADQMKRWRDALKQQRQQKQGKRKRA